MDETEKKAPPPYATYKSFSNFINGLRENGMPSHITRTILPGSNSGKATMAGSLRAMGLIKNTDEPSETMERLASPEEDYSKVLHEVIMHTYNFMSDPEFDIKTTTTDKVVEKFKNAGAGGSTITKCMAFFLAACEDANIEVSKYVKAPAPNRTGAPKRRASSPKGSGSPSDGATGEDTKRQQQPPSGMDRITIPLRNMDDGIIYFPKGLEGKDAQRAVEAAVFNLRHYYDLDDED